MISKLLLALALTGIGGDAYLTNHLAETGKNFHEQDPIVAPFAYSRLGRIGYFSAYAGTTFVVSRELQKHHHSRLRKAFDLIVIGDEAFAINYSLRHMNERPKP